MQQPSFFPDFFVVGAPRCGTTALCRYLSKHPKICFSRPKEPHYFTRLAPEPPDPDLESGYLARFFPHRGPEHERTGEGSVSTLYSARALAHIVRLNPGARFVAQLRNPFEMLPSYHLRLLFVLEEEEPDFAAAWALQAARARGERLPPRARDPLMLQYAEVASFGKWIEQLQRSAPREQCLVLLYDDFAADPRKVYEQVLRFLGLEFDGRDRWPRKQPSRAYRQRWLQELLYRPPRGMARLAESAASGAAPRHEWLRRARRRLLRWNTVYTRPAPLSPELRAEIHAALAADIAKLSDLLGRDLSHWR
jgi:hypothetical protein